MGRGLRAELAQSKQNGQNANDEWLSEQARRKASDDADARRRKLEDAEARRREEEARRLAEEEEAARRKLLLQKQGDDENLNKIRKMMSHWLNQNMSWNAKTFQHPFTFSSACAESKVKGVQI